MQPCEVCGWDTRSGTRVCSSCQAERDGTRQDTAAVLSAVLHNARGGDLTESAPDGDDHETPLPTARRPAGAGHPAGGEQIVLREIGPGSGAAAGEPDSAREGRGTAPTSLAASLVAAFDEPTTDERRQNAFTADGRYRQPDPVDRAGGAADADDTDEVPVDRVRAWVDDSADGHTDPDRAAGSNVTFGRFANLATVPASEPTRPGADDDTGDTAQDGATQDDTDTLTSETADGEADSLDADEAVGAGTPVEGDGDETTRARAADPFEPTTDGSPTARSTPAAPAEDAWTGTDPPGNGLSQQADEPPADTTGPIDAAAVSTSDRPTADPVDETAEPPSDAPPADGPLADASDSDADDDAATEDRGDGDGAATVDGIEPASEAAENDADPPTHAADADDDARPATIAAATASVDRGPTERSTAGQRDAADADDSSSQEDRAWSTIAQVMLVLVGLLSVFQIVVLVIVGRFLTQPSATDVSGLLGAHDKVTSVMLPALAGAAIAAMALAGWRVLGDPDPADDTASRGRMQGLPPALWGVAVGIFVLIGVLIFGGASNVDEALSTTWAAACACVILAAACLWAPRSLQSPRTADDSETPGAAVAAD